MKFFKKSLISVIFLILIISNVSAIYIDDFRFCSNQPEGEYCEEMYDSCETIGYTNVNDDFFAFYSIREMIHNGHYSVTHEFSVNNPDGYPYIWPDNVQYYEYLDEGEQEGGYKCIWFNPELETYKTGTWSLRISVEDNIDYDWGVLTGYIDLYCEYNEDCGPTGVCENEECVFNYVPIPISPNENGQVTNPEENGRLDVFGDLYFEWSRIEEATDYRIAIKYKGNLREPFDFDPVPDLIIPQPSEGNPRYLIPAEQMDKQPMGNWAWRIESYANSEWNSDETWYPFTLDMIPAITTPNGTIISQPGDTLMWGQLKHNAAVRGLGTDGGPDYVLIRLRGVSPGTLCNAENENLPAMCYITLTYLTSNNPDPNGINKGNYLEFDEATLNVFPSGNYEWSIAFFEGKIPAKREDKVIRMKKTAFGPISTFTVQHPWGPGGAVSILGMELGSTTNMLIATFIAVIIVIAGLFYLKKKK